MLSTDSVMPGRPPVTLLACPACDTAFLADRTPPDYALDVDRLLDYYVEQGAGIDLLVAPLLRLPAGAIRRCLEIGCSAGFALDFGRFAFGWETLGIDPSPLATAGAQTLGFAVRRDYFGADLDLGPEPFDLAICSEVLEHLAEPHALLAAIRERLTPNGLLVLSTPNLALVRPDAEREALHRALSPGFHLVLYSRDALVRVLRKAGFAAVQVEASAETLRAFAGRSPDALAALAPADSADPATARALLRDYFASRAASAPQASAFACGFAYRHFKECVNAGLYREAEASRERLAGIYRERYGLALETPDLTAGRALPFNLTGALFFSGILELNGLARPERAAADFAAAVAAAALQQGGANPFALRDGETAELAAQSRKHLPMALAATDPDRAVRELEALARTPAIEALPAPLLAAARAQTFIRLVNAGAYAAAERLADGIPTLEGAVCAEEAPIAVGTEALDALYCLAMLALQRDRPDDAAELFARVHRLAGPRAEIRQSARFHAELSLRRAAHLAAGGRPPIALDCRGDAERTAPGLLLEERGMAVFRQAGGVGGVGVGGVRPIYGLDVFWCDAHGLYLRGWVHAHEHRVRALTIESAGRSTRVETFADRPDLLAFYPEHEHVRHAGFTVYLACPPGRPVRLTLATDGGRATLPLPLPEGPLPPWPDAFEDAADDLSPLLRRFVDLTNAHGGRVLQVGSRSPAGHAAAPPRPALRGPVTGLDIHPGFAVDLVSDAHCLSLRDRSFGAVVSASVLEHLEAPWLFAAEANRVLQTGGLLYHAAPGAWPAHAQPNDFWRMSAEGLRVLFGPESGFEVLEARDSGRAVLLPSPRWRHRHLDMPTVPIFALAEILARKVEDLEPGAVAWPRRSATGEARARRYPVSGLRLPPDAPEPRGGKP